MKDVKSKELANKGIWMLVILLFISNIYFYSRFNELKINTNYTHKVSSAIAIAGISNDMSFLLQELNSNDLDNLINKFEEIKPKIGDTYSIKEYIAITYRNGNTVMIEVTEDEKGKGLIQDMFLLDESTYNRIEDDKM